MIGGLGLVSGCVVTKLNLSRRFKHAAFLINMFSVEVRNFVIKQFYLNRNAYAIDADLIRLVQAKVQEEFGETIAGNSVRNVIKRFETPITEHRHRNVNDQLRANVIGLFEEEPDLTLRQVAARLQTSRETVRRILKIAGFKAFKPIEVHKLTPTDKRKRLEFCNEFRTRELDARTIWFSDEKMFCLNKRLNHQNNRMWCREKPSFFNQLIAHSPSIHVWCALSANGIIGPFVFDTTVDQFAYQKCIDLYFTPQLRDRFGLNQNHWFQQDGAPAHCSDYSIELLRVYFDDRLISRKAEFQWPAHSPDLNPLDFFLWGHVEAIVLKRNPKTTRHLQRIVQEEIEKVNCNLPLLSKVIDNFQKRIDACIEQDGGHFADLL